MARARTDLTGMSSTATPHLDLAPVYRTLLSAYGPQGWWPGDSPFEIMVGAILVQNTAWRNVEQAIANLKHAGHLDPRAIMTASHEQLTGWIRPSGYFNVKAQRLRNFCQWYTQRGGFERLADLETPDLRRALLAVNGIGPETTDDIALYAFDRRVFVVDAYTRRLLARLAWVQKQEAYESLRRRCEEALQGQGVNVHKELHALIVHHSKHVCRLRPLCAACCLRRRCPSAQP